MQEKSFPFIRITDGADQDLSNISRLLADCGLPTPTKSERVHFLVAQREDATIFGCIGWEHLALSHCCVPWQLMLSSASAPRKGH